MFTPCKQPKRNQIFGTPLNLPSSPMLKQLGYGTGKLQTILCGHQPLTVSFRLKGIQVFRFQRPPDATGSTKSPWALKCLSRVHNGGDSKNIISKRLLEEADILRYVVQFVH